MGEAAFVPVADVEAPEPVAVGVPEVLEPDPELEPEPDVPVAVVFELDPVVVADVNPVLELDAAELVEEE